jgi:hypothetical protein
MAMHLNLTFTGDGLATLVAGIIAFVAVMVQIRHSSNATEKQLRAEREARMQQESGQTRALATAILFEIDTLYRYLIRDVHDFFKREVPDHADTVAAKSVDPLFFAVYQGNAGKLGRLGQAAAEAVVHFYGGIGAYAATLREYKIAFEHAVYEDLQTQKRGSPFMPDCGDALRLYLDQLRTPLLPLKNCTYIACYRLCQVGALPFEPPSVAVAADQDVDARIKKAMEHSEHEPPTKPRSRCNQGCGEVRAKTESI